LVRAEES